MILKFVFEIIIWLIGTILNLIGANMGGPGLGDNITAFINLLAGVMQQAMNFVYFTVGNSWYTLLTAGLGILGYRYFIFPIVVILRRVFIKGGDS